MNSVEEQVSLFAPDTWSRKTSLERSAPKEEKTSPPSSPKRSGSSSRTHPMCLCLKRDGATQELSWETDGALLGALTTRNTGESPNAAVESRLSAILEEQPLPKYSLSAKACLGILRRENKRGKKLPELLEWALKVQSLVRIAMEMQEDGKEIPPVAFRMSEKYMRLPVVLQMQNYPKTMLAPLCLREQEQVAINNQLYLSQDLRTEGSGAGSVGVEKEKSPTLCSEQMPAVLVINDQGGSVMDVQENVVATLRAQSHGHEPLVFSVEHHPNDSRCKLSNEDICQSPTSRMGTGGGNVPMVLCAKPYQETTGPIMANSHPGSYTGQDAYNDMLIVNGIDLANMVRRLTPLECERLQGYPDGWTDIGEWVDSNGKKHKDADSPRYKALGNSIALPFWYFLSKRISAQYTYRPTLGSLFDGIGGFPLCWESINGDGTALWASEIDEFPMATTRIHFEEE